MESETPSEHDLKEVRIGVEAQQQFLREQQQQRIQSQERIRQRSHNKSRVNEEEKNDFQKLYKMQMKKCEELWIEMQRLILEYQRSKKLYKEMLSNAEKKTNQVEFKSRKKIKELTDENTLLSHMNTNNSKVLENAMNEMSQIIKEKENEIEENKRQLIELKEQYDVSQKKIEETELMQREIQFSVQSKNREIQVLKNRLTDVENQNCQKLREKDQEIARHKDQWEKIHEQNISIQQKLQNLQQKYHKQQLQNTESITEIKKLRKQIYEKENLQFFPYRQIYTNQHTIWYYLVIKLPLFHLMMINSQVLQNGKQLEILHNFFQHKKLKGFKLLFRASAYGFDVKNYKEKYCGVEHTVLLVKTKYGKLIGGYTPLKWKIVSDKLYGKNTDEWQFQKDISGESFIFSVSNNHKLTLQSPTFRDAICHQNYTGPMFSGGIGISDKSNIECKSFASPHNSYQYVHHQYKGKGKESCIDFTGSSDDQFLTQQWQVHQVIFQEQ